MDGQPGVECQIGFAKVGLVYDRVRVGGGWPTRRSSLRLFRHLKAALLDNSVEAEMRRLAHVQLLILDVFALQPLDTTETTDFYELIVERYRKAATVLTSEVDHRMR